VLPAPTAAAMEATAAVVAAAMDEAALVVLAVATVARD